MEFYLDLLFDLYGQGDRFFGVFTGSKYLLTMKVCIFDILINTNSECGNVSYYP